MATKRGKRAEDRESRVTAARQVASELLDQLEDGTVPVAQSLMKAKRLARLLRDTDIQKWLDYETRGYPDEGFLFDELGAAVSTRAKVAGSARTTSTGSRACPSSKLVSLANGSRSTG